MRGWAEFDLLAQLSKEKITKLKIKFNVSEESTANDHMVPGSHNLVITKFPFNIRIEKPSVIVDYFDKLDINDSQKNLWNWMGSWRINRN
ncbi:MAG: hypothetical protein H6613_18205 [Ignavibacteriales bacterium]|nr:hypothetical protein [Ignavibacteriales bacterium]